MGDDNERVQRSVQEGNKLMLFSRNSMAMKSDNHRVVWIGRDLKDHLFPTLPRAGTSSTNSGCSKPDF